jgi:hypothetical protein
MSIALAFIFASTAVKALPDFDNYTQIPGVSFESLCADGTRPSDGHFIGCDGHGGQQGSYYKVLAPDPAQPNTYNYNSTKQLHSHPEILGAICDAYSDACDWHKDFGCAIGKRVPNATVSTYLRNSKGTFKDGSVPGSRYFVTSGGGTQQWCTQYAGWALPASEVARQCEMSPKCDGFHMRNDNTFGALCAYNLAPNLEEHSYFKLS